MFTPLSSKEVLQVDRKKTSKPRKPASALPTGGSLSPSPISLSGRLAHPETSLGALKCCYLYNPVSCLNPMNDDFTGD